MNAVKFNDQGRSPKSRAYRMRRRAKLVEQTRQRITEAAVRLHTSIGPSATSMAAVADEAGVTRLTLSRHFASRDELFAACMTHWRATHPPPDPSRWARSATLEARLRRGLTDLYRWYGANHDALYPVYRDAAFTPESTHRARRANNDRMVDAIIGATPMSRTTDRRVRAALGHVIGFWAWRSLVVEQELPMREAVALAASFVLGAAMDEDPAGVSR